MANVAEHKKSLYWKHCVKCGKKFIIRQLANFIGDLECDLSECKDWEWSISCDSLKNAKKYSRCGNCSKLER